jgi:hypothetical protein
MTAMRKAMTDAGLDADQRLLDLENRIVEVNADRLVAYGIYTNMLRDDPAMLWAAFAKVRESVLQTRIAAAYARLPKKKRVGHTLPDDQPSAAPRQTARLDFTAQRRALAPIVRSILDTMMTPLGRPLGEITGSEAKNLHARTKREMKIYAYVASHTPPDELVKDFVKAKDLEAIARAAEMENDHA